MRGLRRRLRGVIDPRPPQPRTSQGRGFWRMTKLIVLVQADNRGWIRDPVAVQTGQALFATLTRAEETVASLVKEYGWHPSRLCILVQVR